jgi:AraC-like DNA-binding protein
MMEDTDTPTPLDHDDQIRISDVDAMRDTVARSLCPHELALVRPTGKLDARLWSRRLRDVAINDIAYGDDMKIVPGFLESFFAILIPLAGTSAIRCGHQETWSTQRHVSVPTPTEWLTMRSSRDCVYRVVRIERPALEVQLRDMLGTALPVPVRFSLSFDATSGQGRALVEDIGVLAHRLERDPAAYESPFAISSAEQSLMTRLLLAARHNYSGALAQDQPIVPSRVVSTTIEMMHAHPEWDHTPSSLARAQGVSSRTLERAFKRDKGTGPMAYLRGVRLDRARSTLRAAAPGQVSVGQVARRWGFVNRSRFAADYRRRHGELPSQTLRK